MPTFNSLSHLSRSHLLSLLVDLYCGELTPPLPFLQVKVAGTLTTPLPQVKVAGTLTPPLPQVKVSGTLTPPLPSLR